MTTSSAGNAIDTTVTVTKKMMQDYRAGGTTGAPMGQLIAYTARDGSLHIFFMNVGQPDHGAVLHLFRDPTSDTGWSQSVVSEACSSFQVERGENSSDRLLFFTLTGNGAVISARHLDDSGIPTGPLLTRAAPGLDGIVPFLLLSPAYKESSDAWGEIVPLASPSREIFYFTDGDAFKTEAAPNTMVGPKYVTAVPYQTATSANFLLHTAENILTYHLDLSKGEGATAPVPVSRVVDCALFANARDLQGNAHLFLVSVDGSNNLTTTVGYLDFNGAVTWHASQSSAVSGAETVSFRQVLGRMRPDHTIELLLCDANGRPWSTTGSFGGTAWADAIELGGNAAQSYALVGEHGLYGYVADLGGAITLSLRNEHGDWSTETIEVPGEGVVSEVTIYRAGVTLTDQDGNAIVARRVIVEAATTAVFTLNGSTYDIGPGRPATVDCDGTGSIWISVEIQNSLAAPTLTLRSASLGDAGLILQADADNQKYLESISADALLSAQDPRTGTPLLDATHHDPIHAQQVAGALAQLAGMAAHFYRPLTGEANMSAGARGQAYLVSDSGAWWETSPRNPRDLMSAPGWRFSMRTGKPVFTILSRPEAEAFIQSRNAVGPFGGFLGIDWGSAWDSVVSGLTSVYEITVTAAKATVTFVIDGVHHVIDTVLDGAAKVFDLVTGVFDAVGTVLGTVVGWLLKALGFLFDWEKILAKRTELKAVVRQYIEAAPGKIGDPLGAVQPYLATLDELRTSFNSWAATFKTSTVGTQTLAGMGSGAPTIAKWFSSNGSSTFPQATWLTDKLQEALSRHLGSTPTLQLPGGAAAVQAVVTSFQGLTTSFAPLTDDVLALVGNLFPSTVQFDGVTLTPFLDLISRHLDTIIDAMKEVVLSVAQLLHLAWANPSAIVDWMDTPIQIPFFSAFYKAVLDNSTFSLLDVICLAAAIPASISDTVAENIALGKQSDLVIATLSFSVIGCITTALAEGFAFADMGKPSSRRSRGVVLGALDKIVLVIVCALLVGQDGWNVVAVGQGIGALLYFLIVVANPSVAVIHAFLYGVIISLDLVPVYASKRDPKPLIYLAIGVVQSWLSAAVASFGALGTKAPQHPAWAIGYGAVQGSCSGARTYLWYSSVPGTSLPA